MSWKLLEVKVTSYYEESKQARIMVEGIKREGDGSMQESSWYRCTFHVQVED